MVNQVSNPVRWDLCMATMAEETGDTPVTMIELLPGGTLTGLAKRGLPGSRTVALKTPADLTPALDAAKEAIK